MLSSSLVLLLTLAQSAPPRAQAPVDANATTLATGWNAVAAGKLDAAVKSAETILRTRPWDRAALQLKITALAKTQVLRGLDEYERWIAAGHPDDAGLLEPVAIAVLQEIAAGPRPELETPALRALTASQVPGAREALAAAGGDAQGQLESEAAAATAGDAAAQDRLVELTKSANPSTRAAAVHALEIVKSDAARAAVEQLQSDPDPAVRMATTIALARMGDQAALTAVDQMLASGVPDVQIMAARVFEGRPGAWVAVIRPLLDNPDGLTKLEAARAIAPVDPAAASRVLTGALSDTNPVVRYQSAKVLEETGLSLSSADIATLRQRLRDDDPAVRLAVASALLRLARQ